MQVTITFDPTNAAERAKVLDLLAQYRGAEAPAALSPQDIVLDIFNRHGGKMRWADYRNEAVARGIRSPAHNLNKAIDAGTIRQLERGLYKLAG